MTMYAGFWKRFFAAIIDGIILNIISYFGGYLIGFMFYEASYGRLMAASYILAFVATWLYHAFLECSSKQATWGKQIIGIKVTNLTGDRVGFGQASGRYFGMILSTLTLGIGFLMAGFTKKKQGLHDIVSGCLVVNKDYIGETKESVRNINNEINDNIQEKYWKEAYNELDNNRNIGVWAKVFSENKGDEPAARADYIKIRAQQLNADVGMGSKTESSHGNELTNIVDGDYINSYINGRYKTEKMMDDIIYCIDNRYFAFKNYGFVYFFDDKELLKKSINEFKYYDSSIAILDSFNKRIK